MIKIKTVLYLILIIASLAIYCNSGPIRPLPRPPLDPDDGTAGDVPRVRAIMRAILIGLAGGTVGLIVIGLIIYCCCSSSSSSSY
jgi:hypothetical protein